MNVNMYGNEYRVLQCLGLSVEVVILAPIEMIKRNMELRYDKYEFDN